jgi:transposase InsO family protein
MQRLVSSLPKGRHFWDLLRGDLLHLEDDFYLCHFVDDATHLSVGGVMQGKSPEDVIEVLMDTVLTRPSAPRRILFDNGGEFINEKVQEVLEGYGVEICSTPSYAPWTHGGVERHHVPIIEMARAYKIDLPHHSWKARIRNCLTAKNLNHTHLGCSPIQHVYGITGLNLPDPLTETVVEGTSFSEMSEVLRENREGLLKAREVYYRADVREKIQRALNKNLRAEGPRVRWGDMVMYWRDSSKLSSGWRGPARVVGREKGVLYLITAGRRLIKASDRMVQLVRGGGEGRKGHVR